VRLQDSAEIDREKIGSVAEIEESRVVDKKGNDVVTIKIKQHSRHQALKDLARFSAWKSSVRKSAAPAAALLR